MQKKYYSKFTASKETKKSGSSASSVARNTKSSYDDKPDDIGEIPWLIAKGATEGWRPCGPLGGSPDFPSRRRANVTPLWPDTHPTQSP